MGHCVAEWGISRFLGFIAGAWPQVIVVSIPIRRSRFATLPRVMMVFSFARICWQSCNATFANGDASFWMRVCNAACIHDGQRSRSGRCSNAYTKCCAGITTLSDVVITGSWPSFSSATVTFETDSRQWFGSFCKSWFTSKAETGLFFLRSGLL